MHEAADQTYVELGLSRKQKAAHQLAAGATAFGLHSLLMEAGITSLATRVGYTTLSPAEMAGALGRVGADSKIVLQAEMVAESEAVLAGQRGFWYWARARAAGTEMTQVLKHESGHRLLDVPLLSARLQSAWASARLTAYNWLPGLRVMEEFGVQTFATLNPASGWRPALGSTLARGGRGWNYLRRGEILADGTVAFLDSTAVYPLFLAELCVYSGGTGRPGAITARRKDGSTHSSAS